MAPRARWVCIGLGLAACSFEMPGSGDADPAVVTASTGDPQATSSATSTSTAEGTGTSMTGDPDPSTTEPMPPITATRGESSSETTSVNDDSGSSSTGSPAVDGPCPASSTLLACWDMGVVEDDMVVDQSGNGLDAIATDLGQDRGPRGMVGRFDGDTRVEVPRSDALDEEDEVTIEAWIRIAPDVGAQRVGIFDHQSQYSMFWFPDQGLRCSGSENVFTPPSALTVGTWHHVACVFDGGAIRGIVDGVVESELADGNVLGTDGIEAVAIGNNSPTFDDAFIGQIAVVRVWAEALSVEDLEAL